MCIGGGMGAAGFGGLFVVAASRRDLSRRWRGTLAPSRRRGGGDDATTRGEQGMDRGHAPRVGGVAGPRLPHQNAIAATFSIIAGRARPGAARAPRPA